MTEKEKFLSKLKEKRDGGLNGINFFIAGEGEGYQTEEAFYAELNRMEDAPDLPDPEVLGKFSPK